MQIKKSAINGIIKNYSKILKIKELNMEYANLKEKYLKKLENSYEVLNEVLKYSHIELFNKEEINNLNKLKEINKRFLNKLKAGEIEVAIIGMENSGKSSLANALVKLNEAFPTGSKRTTFTSTRLKYGKEDKAVVEFFTKEEFEQIFKEMLKKVRYPNLKISFEALNIETYKDYFENKLKIEEPEIYKLYASKVHKDILDILEGKEQILKYLDSETKHFSREDIENKKLKNFITDKYIARTVKKVEIFLSNLKNMKEMVLYDVPGFNSLTEKHKIETREALKKADAIILIKNVAENPNITSEEKDILSNYDDLGLPLSEKLFVFGTKIDRLDSIEEVKDNIDTLKFEVINELNVKEDRIFIGSPKAYLGRENIIKEDVNNIIDKMKKYDLRLNEIDNLRDSIKKFYEQEAFNNIQKQINKNIAEIKSILSMVIARIDTSELENIEIETNEIFLNYIRKVDNKLSLILNKEKEEIKKDINNNKYFSNTLEEKIECLIDEISIEDLEEVNKKFQDTRKEFAVDKVNNEIRRKLFKKAKNNFQQLIIDIANDNFESIIKNLNKIILEEVFIIKQNHRYYEELYNKLFTFINQITNDVRYNETSFVYLIDRFSRDLMAIVIDSAKGSPTRKEKFKQAKEEYLSLAFYYENVSSLNSIYDLILIKKILNLPEQNIKSFIIENFEVFKKYNNELSDIIDLFYINKIPIKLSKKIINDSMKNFKTLDKENLNIFKRKIRGNFEKFKNETKNNLDEIFKEVTMSNTKEELLEEINNDIKTLNELLKKAVIKAIGLETAFTISIVKTIDKLQENNSMDEFVKRNFSKVKYQDLSKAEEKKTILEHQKRINEKIKNLLSKI